MTEQSEPITLFQMRLEKHFEDFQTNCILDGNIIVKSQKFAKWIKFYKYFMNLENVRLKWEKFNICLFLSYFSFHLARKLTQCLTKLCFISNNI